MGGAVSMLETGASTLQANCAAVTAIAVERAVSLWVGEQRHNGTADRLQCPRRSPRLLLENIQTYFSGLEEYVGVKDGRHERDLRRRERVCWRADDLQLKVPS